MHRRRSLRAFTCKIRRFMAYFDTRDLTPKSWTASVKLAARPNGPTYSRVLRNPCLLLDIYPLAWATKMRQSVFSILQVPVRTSRRKGNLDTTGNAIRCNTQQPGERKPL